MKKYPIAPLDDDPRFTMGLIFDVATALKKAGFPEVEHGPDFVELQQALFRFVYAERSEPSEVRLEHAHPRRS